MTDALIRSHEHLKKQTVIDHYIESVNQAKVHLCEQIDYLNSIDQPDTGVLISTCELIIKETDTILSERDLYSKHSRFLKNLLKSIEREKAQVVELYNQLTENLNNLDFIDFSPVDWCRLQEKGYEKFYVSLYQHKGYDLTHWELLLDSIEGYTVGRPIYRDESEILAALRLKKNTASEAYAVVAVHKDYVSNNDFLSRRQDPLGNPLIVLLPKAIQCENILEFVHQGARYYYKKKKLIRV